MYAKLALFHSPDYRIKIAFSSCADVRVTVQCPTRFQLNKCRKRLFRFSSRGATIYCLKADFEQRPLRMGRRSVPCRARARVQMCMFVESVEAAEDNAYNTKKTMIGRRDREFKARVKVLIALHAERTREYCQEG